MEFFVDVLKVGLDRRDRNLERFGDFFGTRALRDLPENLFLARSELLGGGMRTLVLVKRADDQSRNFSRHRRAALVDLLDGFEDFCRRRAAHQQIAAGACLE